MSDCNHELYEKDDAAMDGLCAICLQTQLAAAIAERDALKVLAEVRGKGCQCGDDDACAFVRERDALVVERDALVAENKSLLAHSYTKTARCPTCLWKEINCRCPLYHLPCGLSWGGERPNPPKESKVPE